MANLNLFSEGQEIVATCRPAPFLSEPRKLLVFYGIPSLINGSTTSEEAAGVLKQFDMVVFGAGLENPEHEFHEAFVELVPLLEGVELFGYTATGSQDGTNPLSMATIEASVERWALIPGIKGVLLDEFGNDYLNDDARRASVVNFVRAQNLGFIANAFMP